jgi:hypothetical protein
VKIEMTSLQTFENRMVEYHNIQQAHEDMIFLFGDITDDINEFVDKYFIQEDNSRLIKLFNL